MTVYVVSGEHPELPGVPVRLHASLAGAARSASELANVILKDTDGCEIPKATPDTWESVVDSLAEIHGAEHCWVEIAPHEVQP